MSDPRPQPPRRRLLSRLGQIVLPVLPFIVLALAVLVAIHHIRVYR